MSAYMGDTVLLYLEELIDWESYFKWRKGEDGDVDVERAALQEVLETAAAICEAQEPALRAGWEQSAQLVDGQVVYPPHIKETIDKMTEAGLVSFGVEEEYGGFGLPAFVANVILQMVSRADGGLMTILGLQAGVASDIQAYGSEELKREFLPRFASGEVMGAMDLTEPQAQRLRAGQMVRVPTSNPGAVCAMADGLPIALARVEDGEVRAVRVFNL